MVKEEWQHPGKDWVLLTKSAYSAPPRTAAKVHPSTETHPCSRISFVPTRNRNPTTRICATARRALEQQGWTVTVSDLYQMGFDPCERASHYADNWNAAVRRAGRAAPRLEQRRIPADVAAEIARLEQADLLILQYPMWWHLPPAMLKGWLDRVFIYGEVYTSKKRFENGRFAGKRAMLSVTVGTSRRPTPRRPQRRHRLLLWPVNFSLAYVGYTVLQPFVAYGVEAGLRYSDATRSRARLKRITRDWTETATNIDRVPEIPFNAMAHWGADGRIAAGAPICSPFIRRKDALALE